MTAEGELYINETCRDAFMEELDNAFGKDRWRLDGSEHQVWNMSEFPKVTKAKVYLDDSNEDVVIGVATIYSKFDIEDGCGGKYIECYPDRIEIEVYEDGRAKAEI